MAERDVFSRIEKTEALVLGFAPVSNSSRVVSWFTRDFGQLHTLIKGAQRPKSPFLGQFDLFYTCELIFYARSPRLPIARECSPLKTRARFRSDWKACAAASYLVALARRTLPRQAPHRGLYAFLDLALDELAQRGASPAFLLWCELQWLAHHGLAPKVQTCVSCAAPTAPSGKAHYFSHARGGILCAACAEHQRDSAFPIAPDTLALLSAWQQAPSPRSAHATRCSKRQLQQLDKILGGFLAYHLELLPAPRRIAYDLLSRAPLRRESSYQ